MVNGNKFQPPALPLLEPGEAISPGRMKFSGSTGHDIEAFGEGPDMAVHQVGGHQENTVDAAQHGDDGRIRGHFFPLKITFVNRSMNVSFGSMTSLS